jgi:Xaa-Pro dipeptidase
LRFSEAEMARRYALTLELIDRLELGALVIYGNSGVNRHNHANHFWLSQWQDMHHCYLVVPREGEMTLLVGLVNHVPNARELTDLPDVEWGGYEPGKTIAKLVSGRLGLVGVNATWSDGMPWQHYEDLRETGAELADVTREYAALRRIKSDEEVERLRGAAELSDLAITTLVDVAKPGLSETELVARVEESYRRRGGTTRITFLRSMPMDAPNGCLPAQNPSSRRLEKGDVIITEFSASLDGYSGQVHRPVFVQAEPTGEWAAMFDAARDAYESIARGMTPGSTEGDVVRNASLLGERGYAIYDDLIHGYGTDYGPPLVDRSCVRYWGGGEPPAGRTIEEGMTIVVQPNPITPDERMGLQLGALTVVTPNGAESLHGLPWQPFIAH